MSRDTNFYYSFLALPPDKRHGLITVWDFCRAVDDAADEPPANGTTATATLDQWRRELERCFGPGPATTDIGRALQPVIREFHLPREPFEALIDGVAMDLEPRRYGTFDELAQYCYRVASTVGLICLEIFGYVNQQSRQYAIDLGMALQLTNILRDVAVDLQKGRVYLPLDEMRAFRCSETDLASGVMTERLRELLAHQATRAHDYYARTRRLLPPEDARGLVAAEIMSAIYHAILRRIEERGYDVFRGPLRLPKPLRAWIAAGVWARTMVGLHPGRSVRS